MYPESATPLIVFGRQRAGTRFVTEVLNSFEEVTLQGEIPNPVMKAFERFITETECYYRDLAESGNARRVREYQTWQKKKRSLIYAMWANASQSMRVAPGKNCRYFGYKRPNNEFYFDFYEEHLAGQAPRYVYCVRSFAENYLSIVSRWPDRSIEYVAEDYLKSIRQYQRIKEAAPERVLIFNLDDHMRYGFSYVERNVLSRLELSPDESLREKLAGLGAVNETDKIAGVVRRRELSSAERIFIQSRSDIDEEFGKLVDTI